MGCAKDTADRVDTAVKGWLDTGYETAGEVIRENLEDMDYVVTYLLEKETFTGAEVVAIIEGRDPELVENPYASTRPSEIEAPAKKVHMISQKIEAPESTQEDASAAAPVEAAEPPKEETTEKLEPPEGENRTE